MYPTTHALAATPTPSAATGKRRALSGINIRRSIFLIFVLMGLLSGIAGIVLASYVGYGTIAAGQGYELDAIASAILGGTSTLGGVGTVFGALIGSLIMSSLTTGLQMLNVRPGLAVCRQGRRAGAGRLCGCVLQEEPVAASSAGMAGNTNVPGTLHTDRVYDRCCGASRGHFSCLRLAQFEDSVAAVAQFGRDIDRRTVGLRRDEEVAAFPLKAQLLPRVDEAGTADVRQARRPRMTLSLSSSRTCT